jgi:hypothetical protein
MEACASSKNAKGAQGGPSRFIDFCDSISTTNNASPLNGFPPGQGLKSGGNWFGGVANTIQFLTADAKMIDPKGFEDP